MRHERVYKQAKVIRVFKSELAGRSIGQYKRTQVKFKRRGLLSKVSAKRKLDVDEQIAYLKLKRVKFEVISEEQAKEILMSRTYYYKLRVFSKLFPQNVSNQYIDLDFSFLYALEGLDTVLRQLVLILSLDIEHAIKTYLNAMIARDKTEDGYQMILDYDAYALNKINKRREGEGEKKIKIKSFKGVAKTLKSFNKSEYHRSLVSEWGERPRIWDVIELMSYGQLANFLDFYCEDQKMGSQKLKLANQCLMYSKNLRDFAAHNQPILNGITIFGEIKQAKLTVTNYGQQVTLEKPLVTKLMSNKRLHDLVCLIYLHDSYVLDKAIRQQRKETMATFLKEAREKLTLFQGLELKEVFDFSLKLVENYLI